METPTILGTLADPHVASTKGLVWPGWNLEEGGTTSLDLPQSIRYRHFIECCENVRDARKRKRLILASNGDLVDGVHHETTELVTRNKDEQARMAAKFLEVAMDIMKFDAGKGDLLFVVSGTDAHVGNIEDAIARDLDAVPFRKGENDKDGKYAHPELRLDIHSKRVWLAHHALKVGGREWTAENSTLADLRNIYFRELEANRQPPDLVLGAHYHRPREAVFMRNGKVMQGYILPPFQNRTRYAQRVAPNEFTRMGMRWFEIAKDTDIRTYANIVEPVEVETRKV